MNNRNVTVLDLVTKWVDSVDKKLRCIAGQVGMKNTISNAINRPGLALDEEFVGVGENRVQLFGVGEVKFLNKLYKHNKLEKSIENIFFARYCLLCSLT